MVEGLFSPSLLFVSNSFLPGLPPSLIPPVTGGREKGITIEAREQREESVIKRTILQQFRLVDISHLSFLFPVASLALCLLLNMLHCQDGGGEREGKRICSVIRAYWTHPAPS